MDLTTLLNSPIGKGMIDNVASQLNIDKKQTSSAVNVAVPAILAGLTKNAQSAQGAESLNKALEADHDGSLLTNLSSMFKTKPDALQQDGNGILDHVFGKDRPSIEKGVAQQSGLDLSKVGPLLSMIAPIIMAFVGQEKKQANTQAGDLGNLLGQLLGGGAPAKKSTGGGLLGNVVGGLLGGGGGKKSSGNLVNDILGSLLK